MYTQLPKTTKAQTLGKQVLRSGTSVGAQFRENQRTKSNADFINKAEIVPAQRLEALRKEIDEIIAIFVTIVTKVKKRLNKK